VLGAVAGSFLNVVISRGPRLWKLVPADGKPAGLAFPPSRCEGCAAPLRPLELVPIVSYLALRGRCGRCRRPIGGRHLLVEVSGAAAAVIALAVSSDILGGVLLFVLLAALLGLAVIDAETGFLPDMLTLPLLALGLGASFLAQPPSPQSAFLGALIGGGGLALLATFYRRIRGQEGLGGGDVKLVAAGGAWCGGFMLPVILLIASLSGLLFAAVQMLRGRKEAQLTAELRFGPFLCAGIAASYLAALHGLVALR
jgi:leader peptidase (prepilin peptidase)/N-methyltransferase